MRKLRRIFRHFKKIAYSFDQIRHARVMLKHYFGKDVKLGFSSFGGEDMNYFLLRNNRPFAVFRQCLLSLEVSDGKRLGPIQRQDTSKRMSKEILAYTKGGELCVTPRLLYAFEQGVVCEYLQGVRLWNIVENNPCKVWSILEDVIRVYKVLHDAGVSHLDATLKNVILDDADHKIKVFDFEYYARDDVSFELQKAYDLLRLIEHTLRIVPEQYQYGFEPFIEVLKDIVSDDMKKVDFDLVEKYLKGIKKFPIYHILRRDIFVNL